MTPRDPPGQHQRRLQVHRSGRLKLRTNGGTNEATHEFAPDTNGLPLVHAVSTILPLRAGQFVEAVVKQTSGDDLDIALGVDSEFQMCWLAPFPL